MPTITAQAAIELAKLFKESAIVVGQFQLSNWDQLSKTERRNLTDTEYTLLDHSQNLVTYAVGRMLDDAQASLNQIKQATASANTAIRTITNVKKALAIATSLVTLGAAIYTANPSGIAAAVSGVAGAVST